VTPLQCRAEAPDKTISYLPKIKKNGILVSLETEHILIGKNAGF
jgi:hypothetical protein